MNPIKYLEQLKAISIALYMKVSKTPKLMNGHQSEVAKTFKDRFGYKSSLVENFASAFMQFDFSCIYHRHKYEPGMIVVALENPNSHDYTLNTPICITHNCHAFEIEYGGTKNNLPQSILEINDVRLATLEEINSFYDKISNEDPKRKKFLEIMQHIIISEE